MLQPLSRLDSDVETQQLLGLVWNFVMGSSGSVGFNCMTSLPNSTQMSCLGHQVSQESVFGLQVAPIGFCRAQPVGHACKHMLAYGLVASSSATQWILQHPPIAPSTAGVTVAQSAARG